MSWESVVWGKEVPARWRWLQPGPEGVREICQRQLPFLYLGKEKGSSEQSHIPPAFGCDQFSFHCVFSTCLKSGISHPAEIYPVWNANLEMGRGALPWGEHDCYKALRCECLLFPEAWEGGKNGSRENRSTMIYNISRFPSSIWNIYWVPPDLARISAISREAVWERQDHTSRLCSIICTAGDLYAFPSQGSPQICIDKIRERDVFLSLRVGRFVVRESREHQCSLVIA